jgi:hypothetical protein
VFTGYVNAWENSLKKEILLYGKSTPVNKKKLPAAADSLLAFLKS